MIKLPMPPQPLIDHYPIGFAPVPEMIGFVHETLLNPNHDLYNPDHDHLLDAYIGFLFTNADCNSKGRRVAGMCEMPTFRCNAWQKERQLIQLSEWFGDVPDFVITLHAPYYASIADANRLALIEHELYHAAQAVDDFGMPRFRKTTGKPIYAIKGHDVEEFVGVVRRYGAEASGVKEMVDVANRGPEVAQAYIDTVCGTCSLRVA